MCDKELHMTKSKQVSKLIIVKWSLRSKTLFCVNHCFILSVGNNGSRFNDGARRYDAGHLK